MKIAHLALPCALVVVGCKAAAAPAPLQNSSGSGILEVRNPAAASEIKIALVRKRAMAGSLTATAILEADPSMVARVSPRLEARVVRLIVELGQQVKAGDPMVVLSSIEMGKAKTDYLKAKSLESIAGQHLARERKLYDDKIASQKDVLNARAEYDSALAELQASREFLRSLIGDADIDKINWSNEQSRPLSEFTLITPIAGTVVKRDLTPGSIIHDDADVLTVMNLDRIRVQVDVFERDLATVRVGEAASITVAAYPDERFTGTVASVGDLVDRTTRTVSARIDVPNRDHRLKPGMFANAEIVTGGNHGAVLIIPSSAVFNLDGKDSAFLATGNNKFTLAPVQIGAADSDEVQITSGLREGDKVVVEGGLLLKAMALNQVAAH